MTLKIRNRSVTAGLPNTYRNRVSPSTFGSGAGASSGSSSGSGVYRIGGPVTAPTVVARVEPDYSEEARKAKYQGTVILSIEVGADGVPRNIKVARSLGLGLDEKAIEAVKQWRFRPGQKEGQAVATAVNLEVTFRLQ